MFCFKKFVWNFWDSLVNWIFFSLKNYLKKEKIDSGKIGFFEPAFTGLLGYDESYTSGKFEAIWLSSWNIFKNFQIIFVWVPYLGKALHHRLTLLQLPSRTAEAINLEHFQIDNQKSGGRGQKRSLTPCSESKVIKFYFESTNKS